LIPAIKSSSEILSRNAITLRPWHLPLITKAERIQPPGLERERVSGAEPGFA
jgi:hypothetical protein